MQYKILASDYDNTLMPFGEAKPRPAVVKAVKKLQAAGGKFVLSTGRSYPGIRDKNQLGGIRYDYAITCNGACVVDRQGNVIAEHPLTSEEMYVLVDFCEDYNYPLQFNFRDAYYAYCEYEYLHTGYQMPRAGLRGRRGSGQASFGYAPRRLCRHAAAGSGALPRKIRLPWPALDADGRAERGRLLLLRYRARRHG